MPDIGTVPRTPAPTVAATAGTSPWVWPLRAFGVLVVGALVAAGAGSVVVGFFVREVNTSTPLSGVTSVDAQIDTGDISVTAGAPGSDLVVATTRRTAFQDATTTRTLTDGALVLRTRCSSTQFLDDTCTVDLDLTVPPGVRLELSTTSGDVVVDGLSGSALSVRTTVGDVRLDDLTLDTLSVTTAAGDIDATLATPPREVRLRAGLGDVSVAVPPVAGGYRVAADSALGSPVVEVSQDAASTRLLDIATTAGDVRVVSAPEPDRPRRPVLAEHAARAGQCWQDTPSAQGGAVTSADTPPGVSAELPAPCHPGRPARPRLRLARQEALRSSRAMSQDPAPPAQPVVLTVYADGPYVISGPVELRDGDGRRVKQVNKLALCRCGQSGTKPYCDGSHKRVGFTDPGPSPEETPA